MAERLGQEPHRVIGVVVDRYGGSDVVDWDAVVVAGVGDVPVRAELPAVRREIGERVGEPIGAVRFHRGLVFGGDAALVAALAGAPGQGLSRR